jgi:hypothetical protein
VRAASLLDDQPKVLGSRGRICSAACEVRSTHILFYGCDTTLASFAPFRVNDYQGCILQDARPSNERTPDPTLRLGPGSF